MPVPAEKVIEGILGAARMEPVHGPANGQTRGRVTDISSAAEISARNFPGTGAAPSDFHFCSCAGSTWELKSLGGGGGRKRAKGNQRNQGFDAFPFEPRGLQNQAVVGEGFQCESRMEHG